MPIQPTCENCKREGGYTSDVASGLCERCILLGDQDDEDDEDDEDPKPKPKPKRKR